MNNEFDILKTEIDEKQALLRNLEKQRVTLKHEIKCLQYKLENVCDHVYIREETTSGPYRELTNICIKCNKWN